MNSGTEPAVQPGPAWGRLASATPHWTSIARAGDISPILEDEWTLFHAGPPLDGTEPIGPLQGAMVGALIYEGVPRREAESLVHQGAVRLLPGQDFGFASPLVGIVSRNMPVWVVRDVHSDTKGFSPLNEGLGKVLRFGANSDAVIDHLRWLRNVLAPCLRSVIEETNGWNVADFITLGLQCGDDLHNRHVASTSHFVRTFAPAISRIAGTHASPIFKFLGGNDHFLLNLSLAASKAACESAHQTGQGDLVTGMSMNGSVFGIRVAGLGNRWYTSTSEPLRGRLRPGFTQADAAPGIGDSLMIECCGLGGFASAAAPTLHEYLGGTFAALCRETENMYQIVYGEHPLYRIPGTESRGVPLGISVERVLATGLRPVFNGGIAHRESGIGQIGAGIGHAPIACFNAAGVALNELKSRQNTPRIP